ncbi:MAG: class I SAM-dependent methyltransferase [Defluviitaleaceae bacterium]|nr:class I SAM-dependent methyltransferase [Defluviitaleaceae bacterium]
MFDCRICKATINEDEIFVLEERMYNTKQKFDYGTCSKCGCVQIAKIPDNLGSFYESDSYYSFNMGSSLIKNFIKWVFFRAILILPFRLRVKLIMRLRKNNTALLSVLHFVSENSKILDIGCGDGLLLKLLKAIGFKNLYGMDVFLSDDRCINENHLKISNKGIDAIDEVFDFIMLHHSFEHMTDPNTDLINISNKLNPSGQILIRVPIAPCHVHEVYGTEWVALDAPRHLYTYSVDSLTIMAKNANLEIEKIVYDSEGIQFWGSELYKKDIPLVAALGKNIYKYFTKEELADFESLSRELNEKKCGDSVAVYLRRK